MVDDGPSQSEVSEPQIAPANHISLQMADDVADGLHNVPPIFTVGECIFLSLLLFFACAFIHDFFVFSLWVLVCVFQSIFPVYIYVKNITFHVHRNIYFKSNYLSMFIKSHLSHRNYYQNFSLFYTFINTSFISRTFYQCIFSHLSKGNSEQRHRNCEKPVARESDPAKLCKMRGAGAPPRRLPHPKFKYPGSLARTQGRCTIVAFCFNDAGCFNVFFLVCGLRMMF